MLNLCLTVYDKYPDLMNSLLCICLFDYLCHIKKAHFSGLYYGLKIHVMFLMFKFLLLILPGESQRASVERSNGGRLV